MSSPKNGRSSLVADFSEAVASDSIEETQIHKLGETSQVEDQDISRHFKRLSDNNGGGDNSPSHTLEANCMQSEEVWSLHSNSRNGTNSSECRLLQIDSANPDEPVNANEVPENGALTSDSTSEIQECLHNGDACLQKRTTVAVTGAGGFIASWIVKLLLQRGFYVRGTLRNIDDENTAHLRRLKGASERLELLRADILHLPSLLDVVEGCEGVFHTACPVLSAISDPETQMLKPAVEGTLNVMRACAQAQVKRVVMTSSIGAVYMNPNSSPEQIFDESCWSDENYLKDIKEWYCLAKLMAERTAWDYARTHNINLLTICPAVTLGTMLQPRINQSSNHILKYLNGSAKAYANLCQAYVDVEDAAEAHVLAFVTPTATGRYLCCKWSLHRGEVVHALARMYSHYPIPTRCKDEGQARKVPLRFCNQKVEHLGLQFTSFDQTLRHAVSSLQAKGILPNKTTHAIQLYLDDIDIQASKCTGSNNISVATIQKATAVLFPNAVHATQVVKKHSTLSASRPSLK